ARCKRLRHGGRRFPVPLPLGGRWVGRRELEQAVCRDGRRRAVPGGIGDRRVVEVPVGNAVFGKPPDEQLRGIFSGRKMLLVPSFPVRDGKPADRPTLTARPTRFLRVPLEGALAAYDAGLAAVDDQMVGGPIRPEEVAV